MLSRKAIALTLTLTLTLILINTSSVKKMSLDDLVKVTDPNSKVGCPCHTNRFRKFVDKSCGHVRTTDLTIIRNIKLRNLVARGTKYRVPDDEWLDWEPNLGESGRICGVTVTDCFRTAAVAEGFRRWAEKMTDKYPDVVIPSDLNPFLESVIKDVKTYFSKHPEDTASTTIPVKDALWLRR